MSVLARIQVEPEKLGQTSWKAYAARFLLGGAITAATGLIAHGFGVGVGGLFLAFPAILPASATLVEKHSGKRAAADDCLGAVAGSLGLLAFGSVVWWLAAQAPAWLVLLVATVAWAVVSVVLWYLLESLLTRRADRPSSQVAHLANSRERSDSQQREKRGSDDDVSTAARGVVDGGPAADCASGAPGGRGTTGTAGAGDSTERGAAPGAGHDTA